MEQAAARDARDVRADRHRARQRRDHADPADLGVTEQEFRDTLDVNVIGVWHTCRVVHPVDDGAPAGKIVVTGSTCAFKGFPNLGSYVASKHGVNGLMRTLAVELAP